VAAQASQRTREEEYQWVANLVQQLTFAELTEQPFINQ
jgi:alkyl sulfatase BDS1-like metallo-beta-lactamase superfamily hydrolase